jgi:diguanylate cyclase
VKHPALQRLASLVLGPPGRQRLRVSQTLLGLVVYGVFAALQQAEVVFGLMDQDESNLLSAIYLLGGTAFFALVRSGANQRFASDPALTRAQMLFGIACGTWSYAITGPARGAVMTVMVLVIVFGMFALRPSHARAMALFALIGLGAVMLWRTRGVVPRYASDQEVIHFFFAVIVLAGVSALSVRMGALRAHLGRQKVDLERALEQIRLLATRDELTGLVNRRHMMALLSEERERQSRSGAPMCVVLIDIDLFKRINDTHGHQAGDTVLRRFADAASAVTRSTDVLARWGGEEFLMMLPATGVECERRACERGLSAPSRPWRRRRRWRLCRAATTPTGARAASCGRPAPRRPRPSPRNSRPAPHL